LPPGPEPKPVPAAPDLAGASVPETLKALDVDPGTGLSPAAVESRRAANGFNEVAEVKGKPVLKFLRKFWGISAWMLELIMILSAVLGHTSDFLVVGTLLVVNAVLGFLQERRAAGVVAALRRRLQVSARVLRVGGWVVLPARELVPGDVVRLRPGDLIPADVKLLAGTLNVDQSALTGESKDVGKAAGEVLASGSIVRRGEGDGVVLLTGAKPLFGRTTELVQQARPKLHIEAVVAKVVRWLLAIVGVLLVGVTVLALLRHAPLQEMIPLLLVLLLSAVPVSLPVMFTVSMALGSRELARRGVLVTRLSAVEDAATLDVLCVDKTGTITLNQLAVTAVLPLGAASEADVLQAGDCQVGNTHVRLDQPALVVAHHFLELERARLREVEVLHLLDEGPFIGGHDREDAGNAFSPESKVHDRTPYLPSSASMAFKFLKFSGTISTPLIEMP